MGNGNEVDCKGNGEGATGSDHTRSGRLTSCPGLFRRLATVGSVFGGAETGGIGDGCRNAKGGCSGCGVLSDNVCSTDGAVSATTGDGSVFGAIGTEVERNTAFSASSAIFEKPSASAFFE